MTKNRYNELRKDPQFLYKYFVEEGGSPINPNEFNMLLPTWIQMTVGEHPQVGLQKIVNFLDKKFADMK